jgi:hypothetical protein
LKEKLLGKWMQILSKEECERKFPISCWKEETLEDIMNEINNL